MNDLFISYAHEDRERVGPFAAALESLGYSVWWDFQIPPGKTFSHVIDEALRHTRCVIVLWTRSSVHNEWVEIEAAKAKQRGILVPVLLDDVAAEIPLEFSRVHAANLADWHSGSQSPEWEVLLNAIRGHVAVDQGDAVPKRPPVSLSNLKAARRFLMLTSVAYVGALVGEFWIAQYLLRLPTTERAPLYSLENLGVVLIALTWLGVVAVGLAGATKARRCFVRGGWILGWVLAPMGLLVYASCVLFFFGHYSIPYYTALITAFGYHSKLLIAVVGVTVYVLSRRAIPTS